MIKIISDSTCDLTQEIIEKYGISIIPLHIVKGDEELEDGPGIDIHSLYEWADLHKTTPKTSAASIDTAMRIMKENLEGDNELICFSISSEMSTSINVLKLAAEELAAKDRVSIIDSRNLSTGIGLLVVEAAIMAQKGMDRSAIVNQIEELVPKVRASFVVDTLEYLYRGGRCNSISNLLGSALSLHPTIIVEDGKMIQGKKYRGKIGKVLLTYAHDLETKMKGAKVDRVFITHSTCAPEIVDPIVEYINSLEIFEEVLVTRAGGVISSHCGPGTLGVLFIEK